MLRNRLRASCAFTLVELPVVSKRGRAAFTLVELLVVIGIIAVLIGILLPTLHRARRQANRTVTLAHLQQIGQAVANYAVEFKGAHPTNLSDANEDGRALGGLALLAGRYKLPPKLFINPNTEDTAATQFNAEGWPILIEIDGAEITTDSPATIDASNIERVRWHCSFAYDHERKRSGRRFAPRVYLGDRADYGRRRSFSGNWAGEGMCLLWTDQHAEFSKTKAIQDQRDPNIYHHNQYFDDNGIHPGEGGAEVVDGVPVTPDTRDSHLRVFSEEEDDALLPNP
ncbi:MAG: type II secretion system protein [Anaerolineae bacterium]|nr:type II secretion system protein [Phycisphaerae bacterium]